MNASSVPASSEQRKRVRVEGPNVGALVAALAEAEGIDVITDGTADLLVLEADCAKAVSELSGGGRIPLLAVSPRRLRDGERQQLAAAGAARVIDSESTFLDVAFAFSELLFESFAEQRRYGRRLGGLSVQFTPSQSVEGGGVTGRLVGIARAGCFIQSSHPVVAGTAIELHIEIGGRSAPVRGRVAFVDDTGFGVEFALEDHQVAPPLYALC